MHEGNPVLNIQIGGNGASTARLYIYLLNVPSFSRSLFQQNKTNVSFREIARLIARNSLKWYLDPLSLHQVKKRCQSWTPSDETFCFRAWWIPGGNWRLQIQSILVKRRCITICIFGVAANWIIISLLISCCLLFKFCSHCFILPNLVKLCLQWRS